MQRASFYSFNVLVEKMSTSRPARLRKNDNRQCRHFSFRNFRFSPTSILAVPRRDKNRFFSWRAPKMRMWCDKKERQKPPTESPRAFFPSRAHNENLRPRPTLLRQGCRAISFPQMAKSETTRGFSASCSKNAVFFCPPTDFRMACRELEKGLIGLSQDY